MKGFINDMSITLDSELCLKDGQIVGTQNPTSHRLIINAQIEMSPSEDVNEDETIEIENKLDMLNQILLNEGLMLENDLESLLIFKNVKNTVFLCFFFF